MPRAAGVVQVLVHVVALCDELPDMVLAPAGGGAVGRALLETAIRARPLTSLAGRTWRILCGVNAGGAELQALSELAASEGEGRVIVERARADFVRMLGVCE
ncbi:MAG: hypothetical protein WCL08_12780, partial [Verrucomicrobiota bacterium]